MRERINTMTDDEKKKIWSRPKENNGRWKGGPSFNYCECGKKIGVINKTCSKCRARDGKNNSFYGKKHNEETKKKLSEAHKGKYVGNQNIKFMIDGIEYNSLGNASKVLSIPITTIRWRLKSKNNRFLNYIYI